MGSVRCAPSWVAGAASVGAARRALSFVAVARGGFEARGTLCETICVLRVKMTRVFCRGLHRYSIMPSTTLQRNRAMPMSRLLRAVNSPCQSSLGVRVNSHPRHTDAWRRVETPPESSRPLRPGFQASLLLVRVFGCKIGGMSKIRAYTRSAGSVLALSVHLTSASRSKSFETANQRKATKPLLQQRHSSTRA